MPSTLATYIRSAPVSSMSLAISAGDAFGVLPIKSSTIDSASLKPSVSSLLIMTYSYLWLDTPGLRFALRLQATMIELAGLDRQEQA